MSRAAQHGLLSALPSTPLPVGRAWLFLVFSVFLACWTATPGLAQGQDEQPPLVLWHAYGQAEARGLVAAVEAFEADTGVEVDVVENAFGAYESKLENAIPTGHGPDVFIDAHERLVDYARGGLVHALGEPGLEPRLDLHPTHVAALTVDNTLYGLPLALKCAALYVNPQLLAVPSAELAERVDLTDLIALARSLPEDTFALAVEADNPYYAAALLHAYGGRLLEEDGTYAFIGPAAEATLGTLRDLTDLGVIPEEPNGDLVRQLFTSGHAATAISGPWLAPALAEAGLDYAVIPLPRIDPDGERMQPYVTVEGAFVSAEAEAPTRAEALVRFLASRRGALPRATVGGQIVASRSAWEDPALANDATLLAFRTAAAWGRVMPTHPSQQLVWEPAKRALRKVLRAGMPPAEALEEAHRRFDQLTRPVPGRRDPSFILGGLGFALLLLVLYSIRRLRDETFRAELRASRPAYAWVMHAAIAVGLLVVAPLAVGALTSLFAGRGTDLHYAGLANYVDILSAQGGDLFGSGSFYMVLLVTVLWTVLNVGLHVILGVSLAMLLNRPSLRFRAAYRVMLILPWAVPNYVTALSWKGMFHRQFGAINAILEGLGAEPVSFFGSFATAFGANVITNVWLGFPFMMVVTLGALSAIPNDLYEAADVDGATRWQRFKLITVPMLKPMIAPAVAMGAVWTFNMFNVVFLVSGGEPDGSTEILVSEAYRWAFTRGRLYGYAAAYAVLIFGVLFLSTRTWGKRVDGMGATS